jgi:hypothetical protein
MIILGKKETYCFENMHIPRIYINDIHKVRTSLEVLQKKGSLTNKEMTEETERVRSEDIREILYLLWRLDCGINVSKKGREIVFIENDKLDGILEKNDKELKMFILEKLKFYNPFIAILDKLIEYRNVSKKFTETDITKDFHNGSLEGGRIDNTHPLLRWGKDEDWQLINDKQITDIGINYVKEAIKLGIYYIHHTVDLKASEKLNIVAHILSDASLEEQIKELTYEDIIGLIKNIEDIDFDYDDLSDVLKELVSLGLPLSLNKEKVIIKNKIYHDITPQYYIKFKINQIDGIDELEVQSEEKIDKIDENKLLKEFSMCKYLIVHDEDVDLSKYPENSKKISYKEFININEYLPKMNILNIILPSGWKPLKVTKINGILLSFVKFGGNLTIFHAPMGRVGSNRNLFNWLPYDLARISFVHSSSTDNIKGYFTFPFDEKFIFIKKTIFEETIKDNKKYLILFTKYYKGNIIFMGFKENKFIFKKYIEPSENKFNINTKSKSWTYRFIPSINRMKGINKEFDLYPILRNIMKKNLGFEFDLDIVGKPGQTDMFIVSPFFCCCEVTPPNSNATGFTKVSEVDGHRRTMIFKDKKGTKRFIGKEVGACVIGPSFTLEAGEDKSGAIDMANAMNVSLISYIDIYELVCLSEHIKIKLEDLISFFFNTNEIAETSIQIYKLIKGVTDGKI